VNDRLARIASLLKQIEVGDAEPGAMVERFGCSNKDARAMLAVRRKPRSEQRGGLSRGVWIRHDVQAVFDELGRTEGGKGRALATALLLLQAVRLVQGEDRSAPVGVEAITTRYATVHPLERARTRAARWQERCEACGQVRLGFVC
jgi:hypothetical protein